VRKTGLEPAVGLVIKEKSDLFHVCGRCGIGHDIEGRPQGAASQKPDFKFQIRKAGRALEVIGAVATRPGLKMAPV